VPIVANVEPATKVCDDGAVPGVIVADVAPTVATPCTVIDALAASVTVRDKITVCPFTSPEIVVLPAPEPDVERVAVVDAPCESYTTDAAP
jgi:hypothetical protein